MAPLEDVEVGVEWRHDVTVVRPNADAREAGDRARDLGLCEEAHDADLGEAAVVDLREEALRLLLGRGVVEKPKGSKRLKGTGCGSWSDVGM